MLSALRVEQHCKGRELPSAQAELLCAQRAQFVHRRLLRGAQPAQASLQRDASFDARSGFASRRVVLRLPHPRRAHHAQV